jgi:hypothetical protein
MPKSIASGGRPSHTQDFGRACLAVAPTIVLALKGEGGGKFCLFAQAHLLLKNIEPPGKSGVPSGTPCGEIPSELPAMARVRVEGSSGEGGAVKNASRGKLW